MQVHSLQKCLEQTDWDIILGYTHRVRALPLLCGSSGLATDCIEALSNSPSSTESIFPNLRSVGLQAPTAKIALLVRHLANPKLTRISCQFTALNLGTAIATFGERCPYVTDFHVLEWTHADTASGLICCWQNLCSVRCFNVGLNADALLHLSRLHYLRYVVFKVHDSVIDRIHTTLSPASTLTFPTLNVLRLNSDYLTPIRRLFRHFHTPEVHDLSVSLDARPTAPDLMSFFVSLQEACTHTSLNKLSLNVYPYGNNEPNGIPLSPYYVTFDLLRPLAIFVNIKDIKLNIPCSMDLNERELLLLASSWPHLEKFKVGKDHGWLASSAITPGGFLQLLEICRSLKVLSFMFDCRGYTEIPQGHPWRGLSMPKDAYIHLLDSPIEEESIEALSVFFHVAPYPDFSLITNFRHSERPKELCDLYSDRWEQVRSLSFDLWKKKRNLKRSLETRSSR